MLTRMPETTQKSQLDAIRVLCRALIASPAVVLVAVALALGGTGSDRTPIWAPTAVILFGLAMAVLIPLVGYRAPAIAPGTGVDEAKALALKALQGTMMLRYALADVVGLGSVAVALVVEQGGLLPCFLGAVISMALMFQHVWPSDRIVDRLRDALERAGGRSYLREALEDPAPAG
jgi:hypothetical protein